jgi:flagellar basal-body rod protein FlgF
MENVLLIAASRQMTLRREMDVIANNVANVTTNGFKRRLSTAREFQMPVASADSFQRGQDRRVSFVVDRGTPLDLRMGTLEPTNNPMDVALSSGAFFAVQTPQGERFTRNGALMTNANGELVNSDGHRLLGEQGPFQFSNEDSDIRISPDGTVLTSRGPQGKLRLVRFETPQQLQNAGANLFVAPQNLQAQPDLQARVQSGVVERSNVSPVLEISRMIEVNRAYQSVASLISRNDEVRRSAIQRLAEAT